MALYGENESRVDVPLAIVLLVTAYLGGLYRCLGRRSRPRGDRGTCRQCGADVRPLAWRGEDNGTSVRCVCGADLARAGAVRTIGHEPVRRLVRASRAAALVVTLLLGADVLLHLTNRSWLSLAPLGVVRWCSSIMNQSTLALDALVELERRANAGKVTPGEAWDLLTAKGGAAWESPIGWGAEEALFRLALRDTESILAAFAAPNAVRVTTTVWTDGPEPTGTVSFAIETLAPGPNLASRPISRIESVLIDGEPCEWALVPASDVNSGVNSPTNSLAVVGRRVFLMGCVLRCIPAKPVAATGGTLTLRVLLAHSPHAGWWSAIGPHDPVIDGEAPPEAWGIEAVGSEVTLSIPIPPPLATGIAPEPSP
jgi:hypothetical protein